MLAMNVKVQYLRTLVHIEASHLFDLLSVEVEDMNPFNLLYIILRLVLHFKKKFAMLCGMRKP